MAAKTLSNLDVAEIANQEGLCYAITEYMNLDLIRDKTLRVLCLEVEERLHKIKQILAAAYGETGGEG